MDNNSGDEHEDSAMCPETDQELRRTIRSRVSEVLSVEDGARIEVVLTALDDSSDYVGRSEGDDSTMTSSDMTPNGTSKPESDDRRIFPVYSSDASDDDNFDLQPPVAAIAHLARPQNSFHRSRSEPSTTVLTAPQGRNTHSVHSEGTPMNTDEGSDKIKIKFLSAWNNVRNGWTFGARKASFSAGHPIWVLGHQYEPRSESETQAAESMEQSTYLYVSTSQVDENRRTLRSTEKRVSRTHSDGGSCIGNFDDFRSHFESRLWFTYRKEFPALTDTSLTSDCGWGCMLRSGQMMLAQALVMHLLGRDWRFGEDTARQRRTYRQILRWFDDSISLHAPFSLHTLVELGKKSGKREGDWYGPSSVAHVIKEAVDLARNKEKLLEKVKVYVAQDCTVYKEDVMSECSIGAEDFMSVIILVPVRLGGESFNPSYSPLIQDLFHSSSCLGIIGGRPRHSLYFVGYQNEKLIHLDPHFCQNIVNMSSENFCTDSFRCSFPRKMSFHKMDPSCCLGFYCETKHDFMEFCYKMTPEIQPKGAYPMFVINASSYSKLLDNLMDSSRNSGKKEKILRVHHLDSAGKSISQAEDFVFLDFEMGSE